MDPVVILLQATSIGCGLFVAGAIVLKGMEWLQ